MRKDILGYLTAFAIGIVVMGAIMYFVSGAEYNSSSADYDRYEPCGFHPESGETMYCSTADRGEMGFEYERGLTPSRDTTRGVYEPEPYPSPTTGGGQGGQGFDDSGYYWE